MHWLWILPTVVSIVGIAILAGVLRRLVEELQGLQREARRFADLRVEIEEVRRLTGRATRTARSLSLPTAGRASPPPALEVARMQA